MGAHPWSGVPPYKIYFSIAFKQQSITGRPPLGEILYPPLVKVPLALRFTQSTARVHCAGGHPIPVFQERLARLP